MTMFLLKLCAGMGLFAAAVLLWFATAHRRRNRWEQDRINIRRHKYRERRALEGSDAGAVRNAQPTPVASADTR